jgi:hypothetical protein
MPRAAKAAAGSADGRGGSSSGGSDRAAGGVFRVSVMTDADHAALRQEELKQLQAMRQAVYGGGSSSVGGGVAGDCDVFCSTSSSSQRMMLSLVARSSASLDNLFVGVTSSSHTDQRGLQVRAGIGVLFATQACLKPLGGSRG